MKCRSQSNSGSAAVWILVLLVVAAVAFYFLGRSKPVAPPVSGSLKEQTAEKLEKAKDEAVEAAISAKDYAYSQKSEFVAKMQPRLDAMNRELAEASEKLKDASAKAKADAEPRLQALREQSAALGKQLEKVKDATADTWDDVKSGFQTSFDKVKSGLNDAKNWVSDKIK